MVSTTIRRPDATTVAPPADRPQKRPPLVWSVSDYLVTGTVKREARMTDEDVAAATRFWAAVFGLEEHETTGPAYVFIGQIGPFTVEIVDEAHDRPPKK